MDFHNRTICWKITGYFANSPSNPRVRWKKERRAYIRLFLTFWPRLTWRSTKNAEQIQCFTVSARRVRYKNEYRSTQVIRMTINGVGIGAVRAGANFTILDHTSKYKYRIKESGVNTALIQGR